MKHSFLPQHVLPHLGGFDIDGGIRPGFKDTMVRPLSKIREDIIRFIGDDPKPELIGWWSAYDWYVVCRELFGTMGDCMK